MVLLWGNRSDSTWAAALPGCSGTAVLFGCSVGTQQNGVEKVVAGWEKVRIQVWKEVSLRGCVRRDEKVWPLRSLLVTHLLKNSHLQGQHQRCRSAKGHFIGKENDGVFIQFKELGGSSLS